MSQKQKIIKDCVSFSASTAIGQGVSLIRSVLVPILLTPMQFGIWNLMNVIVSYAGYAHLGILDGMNKLIPLLRGQERDSEAVVVKDSVFWVNLFLYVGWFAVVWVASYIAPAVYTTPLRVTAIVVFLCGLFYYVFSLLRADNRFTLISAGVGGLSVLSAILILSLCFFSSDRLSGALAGLASAYFLIVLFWFLKGRYHYSLRINGTAFRRSFATGAPLLVTGILSSLFLSIDRWVIASTLGVTMVGYYAIGIAASNLIGLIPASMASVLYPKMLERFGACGDPTKLSGLLDGPVRVVAIFMSLLIGSSILILPIFIRYFLPKYTPTLPFLGILISAAFFFGATGVPGNFIIAINKQKPLIVAQIMAILIALALDFAVVHAGWGLAGVAWSTATAYVVYGGSYMVLAAYFAFKQRSEMIRFLLDIYVVFAAMVLGLFLVTFLIPAGETPNMVTLFMACRLVSFAAFLFPVFWWSNRDGKVMLEFRNEFAARFKLNA